MLDNSKPAFIFKNFDLSSAAQILHHANSTGRGPRLELDLAGATEVIFRHIQAIRVASIRATHDVALLLRTGEQVAWTGEI
jgi:hypothetical protein